MKFQPPRSPASPLPAAVPPCARRLPAGNGRPSPRPPAGRRLLRRPRQLSSRGGGRPRSPGAGRALKGSDSSCGGLGGSASVGGGRGGGGDTGRDRLPAAGSRAREGPRGEGPRGRCPPPGLTQGSGGPRGRPSVQLRGGAGRGGPPPAVGPAEGSRGGRGGAGGRRGASPGVDGSCPLGPRRPAPPVPARAHGGGGCGPAGDVTRRIPRDAVPREEPPCAAAGREPAAPTPPPAAAAAAFPHPGARRAGSEDGTERILGCADPPLWKRSGVGKVTVGARRGTPRPAGTGAERELPPRNSPCFPRS